VIEEALAVWRLTRLITEDEITRPLRLRIAERAIKGDSRARWLSAWIECPHCVSVWAAAGVTLVLPHLPGGRLARHTLAVAGVVSAAADLREALRARGPDLYPPAGP